MLAAHFLQYSPEGSAFFLSNGVPHALQFIIPKRIFALRVIRETFTAVAEQFVIGGSRINRSSS
jgi:hypothetical protein